MRELEGGGNFIKQPVLRKEYQGREHPDTQQAKPSPCKRCNLSSRVVFLQVIRRGTTSLSSGVTSSCRRDSSLATPAPPRGGLTHPGHWERLLWVRREGRAKGTMGLWVLHTHPPAAAFRGGEHLAHQNHTCVPRH